MAPTILDSMSLVARQAQAEASASFGPSSSPNLYYIVAGICVGVSLLLVVLRLYIRFRITHSPWWDDATVVIAMLAQSAYTGVVCKEGTLGLGRNTTELGMTDPSMVIRFYNLAIDSAILTAPAIYFTKLTLLLLYLRLFVQNRTVKWGIWIGIAVCTIFYTIVMFIYIFMDVNAQTKATYAVAVIGVVSDVYIICLPLIAISGLHLNRTKKWRVAGVFLTGLLAVIMSFLGCVYRFHLDNSNFTHSLLAIYTVNTVEVYVGIICTCLPLMAPLFKGSKESWWSSTINSIRLRLVASRSMTSFRRSRNTSQRSSNAENTKTSMSSSDDINLVQAESTSDAKAYYSATNRVSETSNQEGIWRQTELEQNYQNRTSEV